MHDFSYLDRFGTLAIACAVLFIAYRLHGANGPRAKKTKPAAIILAFLAGCAFLVTFVGGWIAGMNGVGTFSAAGLIVCAGIVIVDWAFDGRPDKPAFWAAFALAFFLVLGATSLSTATSQIGDGTKQVSNEVSKMGK